MLHLLRQKAHRWFVDFRNPETGLVLDRSDNRGKGRTSTMASIAATGYYLSILPSLVDEGLVSRDEAALQAARTMKFALHHVEHHRGVFYHFVGWETGKRWRQCEASVLDTAIFLNGCVVASEAFPECTNFADVLLHRVRLECFLVTRDGKELLTLGWSPETGYLTALADVCSTEMLMPYVLATGVGAISPEDWYNTKVEYGKSSVRYCDDGGWRILNSGHPLFTSNIGLGWVNLKGRVDRRGVDLDANARNAALANRACWSNEEGWWGISAGDSPRGYQAPGLQDKPDGTVAPLAALGAVQWAPGEITADLELWKRSKSWDAVNGVYGLSPFNGDRGWVGDEIIGIDLGGFLVTEINHRTGGVYKYTMSHPVIVDGLQLLGFEERQLTEGSGTNPK